MDLNLKTGLSGFIMLLIFVMFIITMFLISKLSCNSDVEDYKDLIMTNYVILFIILIAYSYYLIFNFKNNIARIFLLILIGIGFILSLVYLIERNNKNIVNKTFVIGSLSYIMTLIITIILYSVVINEITIKKDININEENFNEYLLEKFNNLKDNNVFKKNNKVVPFQ